MAVCSALPVSVTKGEPTELCFSAARDSEWQLRFHSLVAKDRRRGLPPRSDRRGDCWHGQIQEELSYSELGPQEPGSSRKVIAQSQLLSLLNISQVNPSRPLLLVVFFTFVS